MRGLILLWLCLLMTPFIPQSIGQREIDYNTLHQRNVELLWKSPEKAVPAEKELYASVTSDSLLSVSSRLIAVGYSIQNQWDSAMVYHYRSLLHVQNAKNNHLLGLSLNNIGLAHLHLHDTAEAVIQFNLAEPLLEEFASSREMGNFHRSQFLITPRDDLFRRKKSLYTAIKFHSENTDSTGLAFCYSQLSQIAQDSAVEYLALATMYTDTLVTPCDHASNLYCQARIDITNGNPKPAIHLLERALEINQTSSGCNQPFEILLLLSEAHETIQNYDDAREYLNLYYDLKSKENHKNAEASTSANYLKKLNLELSQLREEHTSDVQRIADLTESNSNTQVYLKYSQILNAVIIIALISMIVLSVFLVRNVKENKRKKNSLDEKVQELSEALNRLKSSDEALKSTQMQLIQAEKLTSLGTLVAGVAHEINNPLHYLHSGIYLLRSKNPAFDNQTDEEEFTEVIDLMEKGVEEASTIVGNLKQFSRKQDFSAHTEISLNDTIARSLQLLEHKIRKGPGSIHVNAERNFDVHANEGSVIQIFTNLIMNALFASPEENSIHINILDYGNGVVNAEVIDQGVGIPAEIQSQIFDPFFTTKPTGQGTGLGLSIVHSLVSEQHGSISVESEQGKGAKFTVNFPYIS
ncbi:MAG: ATP-binding protein [Flavobacteriales bacterium]|nr:ATP-binding protein [Flavobacteriales bacterium]